VSKACPHCGYKKPIKVVVTSAQEQREERYLDLLATAGMTIVELESELRYRFIFRESLINTFIFGMIAGCTAEIVAYLFGKGSI
jgi:hypothetical protein